jgi:tripartite-type tricarboxylate transporter receptor subunit TctC
MAPMGTSKEVVEVLSNAFKTVLSQPDINKRMIDQGADPAFLGSEDFKRFLADELPRWAEVVKKSGARVD